MLTILYGTETGTAADVAERIGHEAVCRNLRPTILPMDALPLDAWASTGPVVLVCATTGQGDAPATMRATWRALRRRDCPSLQGVNYAVFGLGDGTYARFNWVAKMVHNRVAAVGGTAMFPRVLGDEQHRRGIDGALDDFLQSLWPALGCGELQLPAAYEPRWHLQVLDQGPVAASAILQDRCVTPVAVVDTQRATAPDHFQDARVVTLHMGEDIGSYAPGDTVEVFPPNVPAQVTAAFKALGLQPDAVVQLVHNPACGRTRQETPYFFHRPMTASDLLTQFLDVQRTVPRNFMFILAQWFATGSAEARERLLELARGPLDDFFDYAIRERRTVWEVLEDFATMLDPIPPSVLLSMLRPAIPREFSIASSSAEPTHPPGTVRLLVGRQSFTSPMGRLRPGVCSNYLCDAQEGSAVMARLSRGVHAFTLPPDPSVPVIAVGPGTGIAPIRALLWELVQRRWTAPLCLVTGHRDREKDYFFAADWEALKRAHKGDLRHLSAFSREAASGAPRYVQHALTQDAATKTYVGGLLLDGAWIYLCGNSKQMPRDVQRALAECVVAAVGQAPDEESIAGASAELDKKRTAGEFQMDTWGG